MSNDKNNKLRLIGKNDDDLKIISAYLQDSVLIIKDIVYLKENRTFIMILNRFMWENFEKKASTKNKRVRCAIKFEEVIKAQSKNIDQKNQTKPLEFLALKSSSKHDNTSKIEIFFSGGGVITIISELIEVALNDLGKPWNVKKFPEHKI